MSQGYEFYNARADESAKEARSATLDKVRERALRAEKTWRGLAQQAHDVSTQRAAIERSKAAERQAAKDLGA